MAAAPVGAPSAVASAAVRMTGARAGAGIADVGRSFGRQRIDRGWNGGNHFAGHAMSVAHDERQADDPGADSAQARTGAK
jgi:hypothetical protein